MGNSYVEQKIRDLYCANPPGPETFDYRPNSFTGLNLNVQAYGPSILPGVNDFSYEFWMRWALGDTAVTSDFFTVAGLCRLNGDFLDDGCMIRFGSNYGVSVDIDWTAGNAGTLWNYYPWWTAWNHVVVNVDRDGFMDVFVNAENLAFVDISLGAGNVVRDGATRFFPITCQIEQTLNDDPDGTVDDLDDLFVNFTQHLAANGPVAYHNRLLTYGEIISSWASRDVQNIPGVTLVKWDWRNPEGVDGWDFNFDHLTSANKIAALGTVVGMPRGAATSITVPDLSGNGNDFIIPSSTLYGSEQGPLNTTGRRAWCGFMSDWFWR